MQRGGPDRAAGTSASALRRGGLAGEITAARGLYCRFSTAEPGRLLRVRHPRLMPEAVAELGRLVGVIYRSDRATPGQPRTYLHFMRDPPRLVSDAAGKQLYVVGGTYKVTSRGIEG